MAENIVVKTENAATKPAAATPALSPELAALQAAFEKHKKLALGVTATTSIDDQKLVVRALVAAVGSMLNIGTPAAFAIGLTYFVANKDGACSEPKAMVGTVYVDHHVTATATAVYLAFRAVTQKYPSGVNARSLRSVPNGGALLMFLGQQK